MVVVEEEQHSIHFLQAAAAWVEVAPEILIQGSQSLVQVHQTRGAVAAVLRPVSVRAEAARVS